MASQPPSATTVATSTEIVDLVTTNQTFLPCVGLPAFVDDLVSHHMYQMTHPRDSFERKYVAAPMLALSTLGRCSPTRTVR